MENHGTREGKHGKYSSSLSRSIALHSKVLSVNKDLRWRVNRGNSFHFGITDRFAGLGRSVRACKRNEIVLKGFMWVSQLFQNGNVLKFSAIQIFYYKS